MTRTKGSAGEHDYTADALRDLSTRGHIGTLGYAWCEREGGFHLTPMGATNPIDMGKRGRTRFPIATRNAQRRTYLRVIANGADAFIAQFEAQRVRPHLTNARTLEEWNRTRTA